MYFDAHNDVTHIGHGITDSRDIRPIENDNKIRTFLQCIREACMKFLISYDSSYIGLL